MPQKGLEKGVEFEEGKITFPEKVFSPLQKTTFIVNGGFLWVNRENFPVIGSVVEKR